jgi:ATP-dependent helicase YprA (DUF1998 family)
MEFDPIDIAQEIQRAYATDFIGERNVAFSNLLSRYGDPAIPLGKKLASFIKMKGPYIQALAIPKWSDSTWTQFAKSVKSIYAAESLDKCIVDLFTSIGFKKLYAYQERAIKAILEDKNTLVVAGTGRGKTESWLIPILQFIILAKRGKFPLHPSGSVKAILVYPTKALAQDQLKRLISYLFGLNKSLPENERITVGVYDGDTPSLSDPGHIAYLANAFKYFKCPLFNSAEVLCRSCDIKNDHSLIVRKDEDEKPKLSVPMPQCREKVPLDFIHLTRDDIRDAKVDILLTNPDTINFRLVNINADQERDAFIKEPKYVVLDEIHTLTGLFGSFVSVLMKRFMSVRKSMLQGQSDDLRVIAGSATIANKETIFAKIIPFQTDLAIIEEEHEQIKRNLPSNIPDFLHKTSFTKEDIMAQARNYQRGGSLNQPFDSLFKVFKLNRDDLSHVESDWELEVRIKEKFFEILTTSIQETPELDIFRALHSDLSSKAMTPDELLDFLANHYKRFEKDSLRHVILNFLAVGELSGILENRVHLFSWPLDGYYSCVNCGKIYESPQGECERCHQHFISRIVVCRYCDEEAIESWFCPNCLKLYTLESNVEGKPTYFEPLKCNCSGEETTCIRTIWRPYYLCTKCGKVTRYDFIERCSKCGSRMMLNESGDKLTCTNLSCDEYQVPKPAKRCPHCQSELELLAGESLQCPACGRKASFGDGIVCKCGATMHPVLYLPWVCDNENCQEVINAEIPPAVCKCGSKKFFLAGLFSFSHVYYCKECDAYFAKRSCGNPDHKLEEQMVDFAEYRLIDRDFRIQRPTESRRAAPCYHPHARYTTNRYSPLARSPENVAVTSAQHALRKIIGNAKLEDMQSCLKKAKMLSFADSHGDMERLNRDFQEPEQEWFIDQLIINILEQSEDTLLNLYSSVRKEFEIRQAIYPKSVDLSDRLRIKPQQRGLDKDELLSSEVDRRIFGGHFYGRWEMPRLVTSGIVDVRLVLGENTQLTDDEKTLLKSLYKYNNQDVGKLSEDLSRKLSTSFDEVLGQLASKKLVTEEKGRIRISPESVICTLVSEDHPIAWDPNNDTFYPRLLEQVGDDLSACIPFSRGYKERTNLFEPSFSKTAYRVSYSSPIMMLSESYKGTTEKTLRRELEYQFKNGCYPNFLSSGPAMELGIDIGDLDMLCLFGTPPNINSYLQRIGRAGRETKKSLVFSVSKRNPIDFYYYRNPLELIQSSPQPVPLNEHNPEVLKISLAWALFDFIATKFWVPWRKETRPDGVHITDGEEVVRKETANDKPDDIQHLTAVYNSKNIELDNGDRLLILDKLVKTNRPEAKAWLEGLLNYSFCPRCGRHYPSVYVGTCQSTGCSEKVVQAKEKFSSLIDDALNSFRLHFISLASDFLRQMRIQEKKLALEKFELEDKIDATDPKNEGEVQRLRLLLKEKQERLNGLQQLRQDTEQMPYSEFHKKSRENKYAFQIRSVEEGVDIDYSKEDQKLGRCTHVIENREIGMALKEYHPYAVTTFARHKRVACRMYFDEWKREEIRQVFPDQLICTSCFRVYPDLAKQRCDCGGDLKIFETQVPRKIEVYSDNYPLRPNVETGRGYLRPLDIHPLAEHGRTVKATIPNMETKVTDFKPSFSWDLEDGSGNKIGILEYGEMTLATLIDSYHSLFEEGFMDPIQRRFELCGVEGCNAVVSQQGSHICSINQSHDPNLKKYVRLAHLFKTYGIRVTTTEKEGVIAHTLAHGIRIGLQSIAGVHIRNIGEVVEDECSYVYDSEPGGSGVTILLTAFEEGKYRNFEHVIKLVYDHLSSCRCADGCPHCIYQYGCAERNDPRKLSRKKTKKWMDKGVILVERTLSSS